MAKRTKFNEKTKLDWLPGLPGTGYDEHAYVGTLFGIISVLGKESQYYGLLFNNKRLELPGDVTSIKKAMIYMESLFKQRLVEMLALLE